MKAFVTFFKPTGKYYADEIFTDFTKDDNPVTVFEKIKEHFKTTCKGMHMVVTFDDIYDKGYPFMLPADQR